MRQRPPGRRPTSRAQAIDVWSGLARTHGRNRCRRRAPTREGTSVVTRSPTVARCLLSAVLYNNDS